MPPGCRQLTEDEYQSVVRWYLHEGVGQDEIARRLGVSRGSLFDRTREARGRGKLCDSRLAHLDRAQGSGGGRRSGENYHKPNGIVPAKEVEARRKAVFASWDDETRMSRLNAGRLDDTHGERGRHTWDHAPVKGFMSSRRLDTRPRGNW